MEYNNSNIFLEKYAENEVKRLVVPDLLFLQKA